MNIRLIKPMAFTMGIILGSSILPGCNSEQTSTSTNPVLTSDETTVKSTAPAVNNTITFIHQNDLHAHLVEHYDWVKTSATAAPKLILAGGVARTATAIDTIRASNPGNTILMNIGDTFHGGAEALYTNGNSVVDIVNKMGVDIGVPGNWDYAYGFNATRARFSTPINVGAVTEGEPIRAVNYPNLAANVTSSATFPEFLPATKIMTINGAKIGFIGLSSDIVAEMHTMLAVSFNFLQGHDNYVALVNRLSKNLREQGVNIVVVMSELGIQKDLAIGNAITPDSVDVIFSAHTHELTWTPQQTRSGARVVESGDDAFLGTMNIKLTNGTIANRDTDITWSIVTVNHDVAERSDIAALVTAARSSPNLYVGKKVPMMNMDQYLDADITTTIGTTAVTLDRRQSLENNFNKAFTTLLKNYAGTQVAMTPGFRFDSVIPGTNMPVEDQPVSSGNITVEDVYRFFPMPFTLSTATLPAKGTPSSAGIMAVTGMDNIIENNLTAVFSTDAFKQHGGWTDGFAGLTLQINLKNVDGARITSMKLNGSNKELSQNNQLSVAGCSRPMDDASTLCSYSGFSNITPLINPATGSAWYGADFAIAQISVGKLPTTITSDITDTSNTAMWPNSLYLQPLYGAK